MGKWSDSSEQIIKVSCTSGLKGHRKDYWKGGKQENRAQQDRRYAEQQERCWTGGIQESWNKGLEGCRKGGMKERRDAGKQVYRNGK